MYKNLRLPDTMSLKNEPRAQPCKHYIMATVGVIIADSSIQDRG